MLEGSEIPPRRRNAAGFFKTTKTKAMTKEQLEKEARKLYRLVYSHCISAGYSHKVSDECASRAYDAYIERFQPHITETQPKPAGNPYNLPELTGPDWGEAPKWATYCAQDQDGEVWWFENSPYKVICKWTHEGRADPFGQFLPPADWENAIWQRPTE